MWHGSRKKVDPNPLDRFLHTPLDDAIRHGHKAPWLNYVCMYIYIYIICYNSIHIRFGAFTMVSVSTSPVCSDTSVVILAATNSHYG